MRRRGQLSLTYQVFRKDLMDTGVINCNQTRELAYALVELTLRSYAISDGNIALLSVLADTNQGFQTFCRTLKLGIFRNIVLIV